MIVAKGRVRVRVKLIAAGLAALVLLGGGWVWLRDSSLVAVRRVTVTGVSGPDAGQIRSVLVLAARNMTTLDVRLGPLHTAVAPYPVVKDLEVSAQFPHGMRIHVVEQLPVAALVAGGQKVAASPDGTLIHDAPTASLPEVPVGAFPGVARHRPDRFERAGAPRGDTRAALGEDQPGHDERAPRSSRAASQRPDDLLRHPKPVAREVGCGDRGARRADLGRRDVYRRGGPGETGRGRRLGGALSGGSGDHRLADKRRQRRRPDRLARPSLSLNRRSLTLDSSFSLEIWELFADRRGLGDLQ